MVRPDNNDTNLIANFQQMEPLKKIQSGDSIANFRGFLYYNPEYCLCEWPPPT